MATSTAAAASRPKSLTGRLRGGDEVAWAFTLFFAALILGVTLLLVWQLWTNSSPSREKFGLGFLSSTLWNPVTDEFGALPFIYGTVVTSFLALLISVPLGVGAAIYLSELAVPKLSNALTFLVELLAAVPSVIFGLIAIFTLVPLMREYIGPGLKKIFGSTPLFSGPVYGVGYLTAGIILAVMTFPFIISVSREALLAVPREQREAALALGATKWESTWQIVVPFARLGIMGSIFLALARALGETMAVTMVIGNSPAIHASLFSPGYTIAAVIANEFTEATGKTYLSALVELGLVLFVLTMVINALAQLLIVVTTRKGSARG
ncbi:MAG TPA: phosphate ABC transporter permease subunit PstC [Bryobacteraceae bacterium]|nr:phosphate ABC transporter permease subunit PstC [Bryobacteraceae bacterium]